MRDQTPWHVYGGWDQTPWHVSWTWDQTPWHVYCMRDKTPWHVYGGWDQTPWLVKCTSDQTLWHVCTVREIRHREMCTICEIRHRDSFVLLSWFLSRDQPIGPTNINKGLFTLIKSDGKNGNDFSKMFLCMKDHPHGSKPIRKANLHPAKEIVKTIFPFYCAGKLELLRYLSNVVLRIRTSFSVNIPIGRIYIQRRRTRERCKPTSWQRLSLTWWRLIRMAFNLTRVLLRNGDYFPKKTT